MKKELSILLLNPMDPKDGNSWYYNDVVTRYLKNFKFKVLKFILRLVVGLFSKEFILKSKFLRTKRKATYPPLPLISAASYFPKHWYFKIFDENVEGEISKYNVDINKIDYIFVTGMIIHQKEVKRIIKFCKENDKKIIAGGPLVSSLPDEFIEIDSIVINEVENIIPSLVNDLENETLQKRYFSAERPNLEKSFKVPRFDLINWSDYGSATIQTARGCPFNCTFCGVIVKDGRKVRTINSSQLIQQLDELHEFFKSGSVFLVNDNFIGTNSKITKKILEAIIMWQKEKHYPYKFMIQASVDMAEDADLVKMIVEANITRVFFGFETPNQEILENYQKIQNLKINLPEIIKFFLNNGIEVLSGLVYGNLLDTEKTYRYLLDFNSTGNVLIMPAILTALPETEMWKEFKKKGMLLENNYGGSQGDIGLNFKHPNAKKIIKLYKSLHVEFYSIKNFYKRVEEFSKDYKHKAINQKINFGSIMAFVKSIFYLGICSRELIYYWKTIIKTIFSKEKIKSFAEIVEYMISGHKYFKVARKLKKQLASEN